MKNTFLQFGHCQNLHLKPTLEDGQDHEPGNRTFARNAEYHEHRDQSDGCLQSVQWSEVVNIVMGAF